MKNYLKGAPKGLVEVHKVAMLCIAELVQRKGYKISEAEEMVMITLKESEEYLKQGMFKETALSLKMIYLDYKLKF